ncbi:MAG: hypothetical protein JWM40_210 [Frankiales bacterium]|nr:hypothetical protein [Frankiales bacterium]
MSGQGTPSARAVPATEVQVGDRIRSRELELTVTRIDVGMLGNPGLIAFVEDSETQWLKLPVPIDAEVEVLQEG